MRSEMVNVNCEMIRDLIPLCSEGLCSETSEQTIRAHIETCESCRKLLENIPADEKPEISIPDESKAFRKVRKKMKRSRLRNVLLSIALAAVVIPVGVLTVGEILKMPMLPSFTTISQSIEVRQQVKKLFSGDIEGYMQGVTWAETLELAGIEIDATDMEELRRQDTENIRQTLEAAYGDTKVKRIDVKSMHVGSYNTASAVVTAVTVDFENGRLVDMQFTKDIDGLYSVSVMGRTAGDDNTEKAFEKAVNFAENHRLAPYGFFEFLLTTGDEYLSLNNIRGRMPGVLHRFQEEYHEQVEKSMTAFYQKDYLVEDCILTMRYDDEKQMLYHDAIIFAKDAEGTAIMKTRFYSTYEGLIPPEGDMITIYTDGCTEELAQDLANLFG